MSQTDPQLLLVNLSNLFTGLKDLQAALGEQKPELIAMYMGKTINAFQKVDPDFIADCKTSRDEFIQSKLG